MTSWMLWLALAAALTILELFSGTFYLLMIALGMLAGALVALAGASDAIQFLVAAAVGASATALLRRKRPRRKDKDAAHDPNINLDIGQTLDVAHWQPSHGTARVMYRGALWDVDLAPGAVARPGRFIIREVRGSRLIVSNQPE